MDTLIQHDTTEEYGSNFSFPMLIQYNGHNAFVFEKQHRSVAEYHYYERENHPDVFYYYAYVEDSIFIMGHDDYFTAYFHQTWRTWGEHGIGIDYLLDVTRHESVILSGKVGNDGIEDFHWGMRVESYNPPDYSYIGADAGSGGQPGIKDILIFKSDTICPYFSEFQKHNFE